MSFPVSLSIEVAWGDMDAFGHVNNTVFFRYFESTRIAYMRAVESAVSDKGEFTPVVASTKCDYLSPVVFPDTVTGQTRLLKMGNSSFTMEYQLTSQAQGKVVARGEAVIVNLDITTGRARPVPEALRQRMLALEPRRAED